MKTKRSGVSAEKKEASNSANAAKTKRSGVSAEKKEASNSANAAKTKRSGVSAEKKEASNSANAAKTKRSGASAVEKQNPKDSTAEERIDFSQYESVDELDNEEMEGFKALQAGNYTLRTDLETKKKYAEIFKEANRRSKAISLRLQERDYIGIRERAIELGIPYQSLINSLIHRYLTGELKANF